MGDNTRIGYLDATWNSIKGCSHVSSGCENCWAERQAARFSKPGEHFHGLTKNGRWVGEAKLYEKELYKPFHWRRPRRIGVCFMGDLFHGSVSGEDVAKVFAVMAKAKQHTFLVLTKRPDRMLEFLQWAGQRVCPSEALYDYIEDDVEINYDTDIVSWPLPNVWLGVSVEDQETADQRVPVLLQCEAVLHYVSAEPLLGHIEWGHSIHHCHAGRDGECYWPSCPQTRDNEPHKTGRSCPYNDWETDEEDPSPPRLGWVICGGESGPCARPIQPEWVRSIRDQCKSAKVPFYFKQWGEFVPYEIELGGSITYRKIGKRLAGRTLDGKIHDAIPELQQEKK